jgi:ankyrin repeat protein
MRLRYGTVLLILLGSAMALLVVSHEPSLQDLIAAGDLSGVQELLDSHPELANALIEKTDKGRGTYSISVLCFSLERRQPQIAKALLEAGANPTLNIGFRSPLCMAALEGYTELIPLLAQKGDNPNLADEYGHPPLALAKNVQTAQALLDSGADVNARNDKDETPLHFRATLGDIEVAALLIKHGANVNAKDNQGLTPLHKASSECLPEKADLLIDHGADVNSSDNKGQNALRYTIEWRRYFLGLCGLERPEFYQTLQLLISRGAEADAGELVYAGGLERLKEKVKIQPELIQTYRFNRETLLTIAINEGHSDIVEYLIEKGADVHTSGRFKDPVLHLAAIAGNPKTAELLIKAGLDINAEGVHGELPLHWVSRLPSDGPDQRPCDYDEVARVLLDAGSQVNVGTQQAWSTIGCGVAGKEPVDQISYYLNNLEVRRSSQQVQTMMPPELAFDVGDTPLHSAARWGRINIVKMLIEAGAEIDSGNVLNQTPLHYAVVYQHPEVVKALLAAGANPSIKTSKNLDAVQLAEKVAGQEILTLLTAKAK